MLAEIAGSVALIQGARIAVGCAGGPEGLLRVGRTVRSGAGAALRLVALAERRATDEAARLEAVGRTVVVDAVAALGHVADSGGGATDSDALAIVRAGRACALAGLGQVADTGFFFLILRRVPCCVLFPFAALVGSIQGARVAVGCAGGAGGFLGVGRTVGTAAGAA